MALPNFRNRFTAARGAAVALPLALAMTFTPMANAQEAPVQKASVTAPTECAPLLANQHGFEMGAGANAQKFSDENKGSVGIAVYPGNDMNGYSPDQIGLYLSELLGERSVNARCFVSDSMATDKPTGVKYKVNGYSWNEDVSLNLQQATSAETIESLADSAKTGRALLTSADATSTAALYR